MPPKNKNRDPMDLLLGRLSPSSMKTGPATPSGTVDWSFLGPLMKSVEPVAAPLFDILNRFSSIAGKGAETAVKESLKELGVEDQKAEQTPQVREEEEFSFFEEFLKSTSMAEETMAGETMPQGITPTAWGKAAEAAYEETIRPISDTYEGLEESVGERLTDTGLAAFAIDVALGAPLAVLTGPLYSAGYGAAKGLTKKAARETAREFKEMGTIVKTAKEIQVETLKNSADAANNTTTLQMIKAISGGVDIKESFEEATKKVLKSQEQQDQIKLFRMGRDANFTTDEFINATTSALGRPLKFGTKEGAITQDELEMIIKRLSRLEKEGAGLTTQQRKNYLHAEVWPDQKSVDAVAMRTGADVELAKEWSLGQRLGKIFTQGEKVLRRMGKAGNEIADLVISNERRQVSLNNKDIDELDKILSDITPDQDEQLRKYLDRNIEPEDQMVKDHFGPKVREWLDAKRAAFTQETGIEVGEIKYYLPRFTDAELIDKDSEAYIKAIIKSAEKDGDILTTSEAQEVLSRMRQNSVGQEAGPLEKTREYDLPDDFYNNQIGFTVKKQIDVDTGQPKRGWVKKKMSTQEILTQYSNYANRRISNVQYFGKNDEVLTGLSRAQVTELMAKTDPEIQLQFQKRLKQLIKNEMGDLTVTQAEQKTQKLLTELQSLWEQVRAKNKILESAGKEGTRVVQSVTDLYNIARESTLKAMNNILSKKQAQARKILEPGGGKVRSIKAIKESIKIEVPSQKLPPGKTSADMVAEAKAAQSNKAIEIREKEVLAKETLAKKEIKTLPKEISEKLKSQAETTRTGQRELAEETASIDIEVLMKKINEKQDKLEKVAPKKAQLDEMKKRAHQDIQVGRKDANDIYHKSHDESIYGRLMNEYGKEGKDYAEDIFLRQVRSQSTVMKAGSGASNLELSLDPYMTTFRNIAIFNKLQMATVANAFQTFNTLYPVLAKEGFVRGAKVFGKALHATFGPDRIKTRQWARDAGVFSDSIAEEFLHLDNIAKGNPRGPAQKAEALTRGMASWMLNVNQFSRVEILNNIVSSVAGKLYAQELIPLARRGEMGALAELKKMANSAGMPEVDLLRMIDRGVGEVEELRALGYGMARRTQFRTKAIDMPMTKFFTSRYGKMLFQFKSFLTATTSFVFANINKSNTHAQKARFVSAILGMGIATGELSSLATREGWDLVMGREPKETPDRDQPYKTLYKIADNLSAAGALGMYGSMINASKYRRLYEAAAGPTVSGLTEMVIQGASQLGKIDKPGMIGGVEVPGIAYPVLHSSKALIENILAPITAKPELQEWMRELLERKPLPSLKPVRRGSPRSGSRSRGPIKRGRSKR